MALPRPRAPPVMKAIPGARGPVRLDIMIVCLCLCCLLQPRCKDQYCTGKFAKLQSLELMGI